MTSVTILKTHEEPIYLWPELESLLWLCHAVPCAMMQQFAALMTLLEKHQHGCASLASLSKLNSILCSEKQWHQS